jgi:hypothetical protein
MYARRRSFRAFIFPELQGDLVNLNELRLVDKIELSQFRILLEQAQIDFAKFRNPLRKLMSLLINRNLGPAMHAILPPQKSGAFSLKLCYKLALMQR